MFAHDETAVWMEIAFPIDIDNEHLDREVGAAIIA